MLRGKWETNRIRNAMTNAVGWRKCILTSHSLKWISKEGEIKDRTGYDCTICSRMGSRWWGQEAGRTLQGGLAGLTPPEQTSRSAASECAGVGRWQQGPGCTLCQAHGHKRVNIFSTAQTLLCVLFPHITLFNCCKLSGSSVEWRK